MWWKDGSWTLEGLDRSVDIAMHVAFKLNRVNLISLLIVSVLGGDWAPLPRQNASQLLSSNSSVGDHVLLLFPHGKRSLCIHHLGNDRNNVLHGMLSKR